MFISFEGIEGSGKSTLLCGVASRLLAAGRDCVTTREPGGTAPGDAVRRLFLDSDLDVNPLAEVLLINASRAQLLADVIRPALAQGRIVLCDRYIDSTLAYQGYGRELDLAAVRGICDLATGGLYPDATFLVDVSVETSRRRVDDRARVTTDGDVRPFEDDLTFAVIRYGDELPPEQCHGRTIPAVEL